MGFYYSDDPDFIKAKERLEKVVELEELKKNARMNLSRHYPFIKNAKVMDRVVHKPEYLGKIKNIIDSVCAEDSTRGRVLKIMQEKNFLYGYTNPIKREDIRKILAMK